MAETLVMRADCLILYIICTILAALMRTHLFAVGLYVRSFKPEYIFDPFMTTEVQSSCYAEPGKLRDLHKKIFKIA